MGHLSEHQRLQVALGCLDFILRIACLQKKRDKFQFQLLQRIYCCRWDSEIHIHCSYPQRGVRPNLEQWSTQGAARSPVSFATRRSAMSSSNKRQSIHPRMPQGPKAPVNFSSSIVIADTANLTGSHTIVISSESVIHPRAKLDSSGGRITISRRCIIHERSHVGAPSADLTPAEFGATIEDYVTVEVGAIIESGGTIIGEGSVIGIGARVGKGAKLGKVSRPINLLKTYFIDNLQSTAHSPPRVSFHQGR